MRMSSKLPYTGINRIRFEGSVSARQGELISPEHPRFGAGDPDRPAPGAETQPIE